jgi:hypothetical protein
MNVSGFSGFSVVELCVVDAASKNPQIIAAYQSKGNLGNPPMDWVLRHVFGDNAKIVVQSSEPINLSDETDSQHHWTASFLP